jgi:hypothetical protein
MSISGTFIPEFDQEMVTTRRLLERVPSDKGTWKPHQKSFPLGHLSQLVAKMPGWITQAMRNTDLDLSGFPGYTYEKTETLLDEFDRNVKEARAAMSAKDEDFMVPWSLKQRRSSLLHHAARRGGAPDHQSSGPSSRAAHGLPAPPRRADSFDLRTDRRREVVGTRAPGRH